MCIGGGNIHGGMLHGKILANRGVLCYNLNCLDLQMGAFFMPNNPILRGKVAIITLGKRPVNLDNLRSGDGYFVYGVTMTKKDNRPCKKCGTSEWYDSGQCRQCQINSALRWQESNPEKVRESDRRWKRGNPEKRNEQNRRHRQSNPDGERERLRSWRQNNRDKSSAADHRRRTRVTEAGGSYTAAEWQALVKQYGGRCACCGKKAKLTADHVIPVIAGGSSDITNIQPLCKSCNCSKGARHATDYRTKPGLLRWIQKRLIGD